MAALFRVAVAVVLGAILWRLTFAGGSIVFGSTHTDYSLARHVFHAALIAPLVLAAVYLLRRRDGSPPADAWSGVGLAPLPRGIKPLGVGLVSWLLPASAGLGLCVAGGWAQIVPLASPLELVTFLPVLFALVFVYEALPEELLFRGYVYGVLEARWSPSVAVVGQTAAFVLWGLLIGSANAPDRLLLFAAFGLVTGLLRAVSGSVWVPIGFHLAFQSVAQGTSGMHELFVVAGGDALQGLAFGLIPFGFGVLIVWAIYRTRPG